MRSTSGPAYGKKTSGSISSTTLGKTGLSATARCNTRKNEASQNSANFAVIIPTLIIEVTPVNTCGRQEEEKLML